MALLDKFGKIRVEKPAVRRLTIEAECDSNISYPQLERVIKDLKKRFDGAGVNCKITSFQDNIHVVVSSGLSPIEKTPFEEYISG